MPCNKSLTRLLAKALIASTFIHSLTAITRHEYCFHKSIHRAGSEKCVYMCPCAIVCFHSHSVLIIQHAREASDTNAAKAEGKSCEKWKHSVIHTPTRRIQSVIVKHTHTKMIIKSTSAFAFPDFFCAVLILELKLWVCGERKADLDPCELLCP